MPKLSASQPEPKFRNAKPRSEEYTISDGNGLAMLVTPDGSRRWIVRYRVGKERRKLAIKGGYPAISLAEAREETKRIQAMAKSGEDPAQVRKVAKQETRRQEEARREEEARTANTFEKMVRDWAQTTFGHLEPAYAASKLRRLEKDIFPYIGALPVSDIKPLQVLEALRKIEERQALETAQRVRGFCSEVFQFAVAQGLIESDPTRDIRKAMKRPIEGRFAALTDPQEVGHLLVAVDGYMGDPVTRIALRLAILTFVRPGNLREAQWSEFHNLDTPEKAEWRIPGEKMKVRRDRPFVVSLAPQAIALLRDLEPLTRHSPFLFPSKQTKGRCMSNNTMNTALRRMGYSKEQMTGHGVRAMARTLCAEALGFPPEVIEEQLAHAKAGPLRDSYDRTTHMESRRRLMREWADYLDKLREEARSHAA
jgi:integrase